MFETPLAASKFESCHEVEIPGVKLTAGATEHQICLLKKELDALKQGKQLLRTWYKVNEIRWQVLKKKWAIAHSEVNKQFQMENIRGTRLVWKWTNVMILWNSKKLRAKLQKEMGWHLIEY